MDLCKRFVEALPVSGASISVVDVGGHQSSVCASDPLARRIDELHFEFGEGPQWEAIRTESLVSVPDTGEDVHARWPMFGGALHRLDVGALFALPLMVSHRCVGAVCLYRTEAGALSDADVASATRLGSTVAAAAVERAMVLAQVDGPGAASVPEMRREVHQATGMILVQLETTSDVALSRLRAYAFAEGRSVLDVARDVVSRRLSFQHLRD